jgi:hypothetical protein
MFFFFSIHSIVDGRLHLRLTCLNNVCDAINSADDLKAPNMNQAQAKAKTKVIAKKKEKAKVKESTGFSPLAGTSKKVHAATAGYSKDAAKNTFPFANAKLERDLGEKLPDRCCLGCLPAVPNIEEGGEVLHVLNNHLL